MSEREAMDAGTASNGRVAPQGRAALCNKEARPAEAVSEADARALVHELQVHQIELEMQNEELQRAQMQRPRRRRRSTATCSISPRLGIFCGTTRGGFWRSTWPGPPCWAWTATP